MASNDPHYLLCYIIFALLPCIRAQTLTNISLGSFLTAKHDDYSSWDSWPSPSGEFAFGFRQVVKGGFLLAIWFDKIPEKTIVWSANRDSLAPQGSKVELTGDGQLVLNDAEGKQIWNAESSSTGVFYAAMLDSGNFVLTNQNSTYLWESFDEPTDTILPTQTLNQASILYARYTMSNYSTGRFLFSLQPDGNLVLYTTNFPQKTNNYAYWSVQTGIGFQVIFNQSGLIYLLSENGTILYRISRTPITQDFYQRATLDHDGVLRHYVYPKSSSTSGESWSTSSFIPTNICLSMLGYVGGGACGFNSLCRLDDTGPTCHCPNGYRFFDPNDQLKGCKQDFLPQSCDDGDATSPEDDFDFQEMKRTDIKAADYEEFHNVPEDWCRKNCLEDCFCAAAIVKDGKCYKKGLPLSNGVTDPSITAKALLKKRKGNSTSKVGGAIFKKKDDSTLIIVGSVLLSSSGILNLIIPLIAYLVVSRMYSRKAVPVHSYQGINLKYFTYEELKEATNEFKEELGRGASATVYKGVLASDMGKCVAVKSLDAKVGETDLEFIAEMRAMGRTNQRNLVQLRGYCNDAQHQLLVYEFMSNGTLASFLFGESRPKWYSRSQIALGVAKGLVYLHEECSSQIIHCDIKPQNILLDDSFTARISDFGLAKLLRTDQTRTTTGIRGTRGYVATEWFRSIPITVKNKLHLLLESDEEALNDITNVERFVMIALWCIQEDPSARPSMKIVTLMLEGIIEVSAPPDPSSLTNSN